MYVCMYACAVVCMRVCMCVTNYVSVFCMCAYVSACRDVCVYVCVCMYGPACAYVCVYVCKRICVCVRILCVSMCAHVCERVCAHMLIVKVESVLSACLFTHNQTIVQTMYVCDYKTPFSVCRSCFFILKMFFYSENLIRNFIKIRASNSDT